MPVVFNGYSVDCEKIAAAIRFGGVAQAEAGTACGGGRGEEVVAPEAFAVA